MGSVKIAVPPLFTYTPYMPSEPAPVAVSVPFSTVSLPPSTVINDLLSNASPCAGPVILPLPVIVRSPVSVTVNSAGASELTSFSARSRVIFLSTVMLSILTSASSFTVSPSTAALMASASVAYSVVPICAPASITV